MKKTTLSAIALVATTLSPIVWGAWQADSIDWPRLLSNSNLDERELHFDALIERAGEDPELRAQLDVWAEGKNDLAWTARLARRELERVEGASLGRGGGADRRDPFGAFGQGFDPFADLERDFGLGGNLGGLLQQFGQGSGGVLPFEFGSQRSFSMHRTPDGVRIEVEEDVDGDTQTKTYEGDSLEALLEVHPELEGMLGGRGNQVAPGGFGGGWQFGSGREPFGWFNQAREQAFPFQQAPRRDVLGIRVTTPESGAEGLLIHDVVRGSLAAELGLRTGETLIQLDGRPIRSVEDVATALAEREPEAALKARVVGVDGVERELEWTPADTQADQDNWRPAFQPERRQRL